MEHTRPYFANRYVALLKCLRTAVHSFNSPPPAFPFFSPSQDAESDSSICTTGAIWVRQLVARVIGPSELGRDVWHTYDWCFCWAHVRADYAFSDL